MTDEQFGLTAQMRAFVNARPGGQQTRTKSAREMVEYFLYELEALAAAWRKRAQDYREAALNLSGSGSGYDKQALNTRAAEAERCVDDLTLGA